MVQSYKDLIVWQRSISLVKSIYILTRELPREELYGLVSQMRRSAVSIPSNIAEGYKRRSKGDYIRFLCIADGSAAELETQLIIIRDLYSNLKCQGSFFILEEVQKMLSAIIKKLEMGKVSN